MCCYIYALKCPKAKKIRYIGKSVDPARRYRQHIKYQVSGNTHKCRWIRSLLSIGMKPKLVILEKVDDRSDWQDRECYWIDYYRAKGHPLTNTTDGGDSFGTIPLDVEAARRDAIRRSRQGMQFTEGHKKKLSIAAKKKFRRMPELREHLRQKSTSLPDSVVMDIYRESCTGESSFRDIAKKYGISQSTVSEIYNGRKHATLTKASKKDNPLIESRKRYDNELLSLYESGVSIDEIADLKGIKPESIRERLAKCLGMPVMTYETMKRKQQVLEMLGRGLSYKEIGSIMNMPASSIWAIATRKKKYETI